MRLGQYIKSFHIKNVIMKPNLTTIIQEVFLGDGEFDLNNYINRINTISEDMPVIIEHLGNEDEYVNAVKRIEFITKGKNEHV